MHIITLVFILFLQVMQPQFKVDRELTPISKVEMAHALDCGHRIVFDRPPSPERLAVAWSQVALENRQGLTVYNHNLGNINSRGGELYYVKRNRFTAYANSTQGAVGYWSLLRSMCSCALPYFDAGRPYEAGRMLRHCGYHRTDPHVYGKTMRDLYASGMRAVRESR